MKAGNIWYNAKEAIKFYFKAETVHTIDSPFLFSLMMNTLERQRSHERIHNILKLKRKLFASEEKFSRMDLGKGSKHANQNKPKLKLGNWAKTSSIDNYYGELLFNLCDHLKPDRLIELGTAAGISAAYLASANNSSHLTTLEADPYLCHVARQNLESLGLKNVTIKEGDFNDTLWATLEAIKNVQAAFIDGNHSRQALFKQLEMICPYLSHHKIVIIDDIRWSKDMYCAWQYLLTDARWNIGLDFYRMGILIWNPDIKHRISKMVIASIWKKWNLGLVR